MHIKAVVASKTIASKKPVKGEQAAKKDVVLLMGRMLADFRSEYEQRPMWLEIFVMQDWFKLAIEVLERTAAQQLPSTRCTAACSAEEDWQTNEFWTQTSSRRKLWERPPTETEYLMEHLRLECLRFERILERLACAGVDALQALSRSILTETPRILRVTRCLGEVRRRRTVPVEVVAAGQASAVRTSK